MTIGLPNMSLGWEYRDGNLMARLLHSYHVVCSVVWAGLVHFIIHSHLKAVKTESHYIHTNFFSRMIGPCVCPGTWVEVGPRLLSVICYLLSVIWRPAHLGIFFPDGPSRTKHKAATCAPLPASKYAINSCELSRVLICRM